MLRRSKRLKDTSINYKKLSSGRKRYKSSKASERPLEQIAKPRKNESFFHDKENILPQTLTQSVLEVGGPHGDPMILLTPLKKELKPKNSLQRHHVP